MLKFVALLMQDCLTAAVHSLSYLTPHCVAAKQAADKTMDNSKHVKPPDVIHGGKWPFHTQHSACLFPSRD